MNRVFLIFICLLNLGMTALCVPAFPHRVKIETLNGSVEEILLKGDEFCKYAVSADGYTLVPNNGTWHYLISTSADDYKVSDMTLGDSLSVFQKQALVTCDKLNFKNYLPFISERENNSRKRASKRAKSRLNGTSHALVILMSYRDKGFTKTKDEFENLFNALDYRLDGADGSVRDFYNYASYGNFDLVCDIFGPFVSDYPMSYYGDNNINGNDTNASALAIEGVAKLPNDLDLSVYDNDGDGFVDNVHIIFAGYGEESGAPSYAIWSHEYPHILPVEKNGFRFAGYSCTPELRSNMGTGITRIGVICHELGHAFGANDYYDVDYGTHGSFDGTGVWDLMASGSWNNNGVSPANFNPYVKIFDFGWCEPVTLCESSHISIYPYNFRPSVYKLPTVNPDEFFLLEYRQKDYFDRGVPGEGILIYHVHPQIVNWSSSNSINNKHPQGFYPVCASSDVSPLSSESYGDINSDGCPFPGSRNITDISGLSSPNFFIWSGGAMDFNIRNIYIADDIASFDYFYNFDSPDSTVVDTPSYQEGFENSNNTFFTESIAGDAKWEIYPTNSLSALTGMPDPFEGKHALMLYNGLKSVRVAESSITSGKIILEKDSAYTISLWVRTKKPVTGAHYCLKLDIKPGENASWRTIYESSDSFEDWTEIRADLSENLSEVYYRLIGQIFNSGIFIDDISIQKNTSAKDEGVSSDMAKIIIYNNPLTIVSNDNLSIIIYDVSGKIVARRKLCCSEVFSPNLPQGIYILCTDQGDKRKICI